VTTIRASRETKRAMLISVVIGVGLALIVFGVLNLWVASQQITRGCVSPVGPVALIFMGNLGPIDLTAQETRCSVHGERLATKLVPISYGRMSGPFPTSLERRDFPFGDTRVGGGCTKELSSPFQARISQCPVCVTRRKAWRAASRRYPSAEGSVAVEHRPSPADALPVAFSPQIKPPAQVTLSTELLNPVQ